MEGVKILDGAVVEVHLLVGSEGSEVTDTHHFPVDAEDRQGGRFPVRRARSETRSNLLYHANNRGPGRLALGPLCGLAAWPPELFPLRLRSSCVGAGSPLTIASQSCSASLKSQAHDRDNRAEDASSSPLAPYEGGRGTSTWVPR